MANEIAPITIAEVEGKLIPMRGQMVLLDKDLAEFYGVETREINQAVKNNPDKFPEGYIYNLNNQEYANLKSKILTSSEATWGGSRKKPTAFTEKGLYMLATILKSPRATQATLSIDVCASERDGSYDGSIAECGGWWGAAANLVAESGQYIG